MCHNTDDTWIAQETTWWNVLFRVEQWFRCASQYLLGAGSHHWIKCWITYSEQHIGVWVSFLDHVMFIYYCLDLYAYLTCSNHTRPRILKNHYANKSRIWTHTFTPNFYCVRCSLSRAHGDLYWRQWSKHMSFSGSVLKSTLFVLSPNKQRPQPIEQDPPKCCIVHKGGRQQPPHLVVLPMNPPCGTLHHRHPIQVILALSQRITTTK